MSEFESLFQQQILDILHDDYELSALLRCRVQSNIDQIMRHVNRNYICEIINDYVTTKLENHIKECVGRAVIYAVGADMQALERKLRTEFFKEK